MLVDAIDVLEEALHDGQRRWYAAVDDERPAKVNTRLLQVLRRKVILGVLSSIVAAEGGLDGVDGRVVPQLVEEGHAGGGLLRFLVAKARVVVDEEWADVGQNEGEDAGVLRR